MGRIDKFRSFTVKVNGGSGCIIQSQDESYSYIFTAEHVLHSLEINDLYITREKENAQGDIEYIKLRPLDQIYRHKSMDAAIIKVEKLDDIEELSIIVDVFDDRYVEDYYVCGHPNTKRHQSDSYRQNKLSLINSTAERYIEAQSHPLIVLSEVKGQSGGGILKLVNNRISFAGVFKGLTDDEADLGRVIFSPVECFIEITEKFPNDLTPIIIQNPESESNSQQVIGEKENPEDENTIEKELDNIKRLISYTRLGDALKKLGDLADKHEFDFSNEITLQLARWNKIEKDNLVGIVNKADYDITVARINHATLSILDLINRDLKI